MRVFRGKAHRRGRVTAPPVRPSARRLRPGFTLIELTASMLVAGVCIGATVAAINVVTTGGALLTRRSEAQSAVGIGVNRLISELSLASTLVDISKTKIAFTHPDLTGDDVDDLITYVWSGTAGDPVTRELNTDGAAAVIAGVAEFNLGVDVSNVTEETKPDTTPELLVASHDIYAGIYLTDPKPVSNAEHVAEYFVPSYANATACRITRVLISMAKNGARDRQLTLSVERPRSGTYNPSGTPLGFVNFDEADLADSFSWQQFALSGVEVPVGQGCLIVLRGTGSSAALVETHLLSLGIADGMTLRYSSNGGNTWSPAVLNISDMRFYVFGEFVLNTSSGTGNLGTGTLETVHLRVKTNGDDPVIVNTAARCMNRPSLAGLPMTSIPTR